MSALIVLFLEVTLKTVVNHSNTKRDKLQDWVIQKEPQLLYKSLTNLDMHGQAQTGDTHVVN